MKLNLRKLVLGAAIATLPQLINAQETVVTVDGGDGIIRDYYVPVDGSAAHVAFEVWNSRVGDMDNGDGVDYKGDPTTLDAENDSYIMPFLLPAKPDGKVVESVSFKVFLNTVSQWMPQTNPIDLYVINDVKEGPGIDPAGAQSSYVYHGAYGEDANATPLQAGFITKPTAPGTIDDVQAYQESSNSANLVLKQFIIDAYAAGNAGKYIFIRLNNIPSNNGDGQFYDFYGYDNGTDDPNYPIQDQEKLPKLTITFGGEDVTPPSIDAINADQYVPKKVVVEFNEPVEKTSAETIANYSIDNGLTVERAILNDDLSSVTLITSEVVGGNYYTVTVNGVEDLSGNAISGESMGYFSNGYTDSKIASSYQDDSWGTNPPENAFDGDQNTIWSAQGVGEWLERTYVDLAGIESITVTYPTADTRTYDFKVSVSEDGVDYTIIADVSMESQVEPYAISFDKINARYVRFIGAGNSVNTWNKFAEVVITTGETLSNESIERSTLAIYPNPVTNGEFTVSTVGMDGWVDLAIYNVTGKKVYSKSVNASAKKATVNANLSQGLYIVKLTDGTSARTQKITVK